MAAITFPTPTTIGEIYTENSRTWKWNGSGWDAVSVSSTLRSISNVPTNTNIAYLKSGDTPGGVTVIGFYDNGTKNGSDANNLVMQTALYYSATGTDGTWSIVAGSQTNTTNIDVVNGSIYNASFNKDFAPVTLDGYYLVGDVASTVQWVFAGVRSVNTLV